MLPLKDYNPTRSRAVVTLILIVLNVGVFLTEPVLSSGRSPEEQQRAQEEYFACRGAIPYEVTHGRSIADAIKARKPLNFNESIDVAFASAELRTCPDKSWWLSIFVSMFLHGSLPHLGFNMLFLWVFGNNVEDRLGKLKYVAFYLLSGIAAVYAQSYVFPDSATPLVGASGAIAGILGAYLLMFPRAPILTLVVLFLVPIPAFVMIGVWFLTQLFASVGSVSADTGVAYMAHVGGFLAGMLLLLIFRPRRQQPIAPLPY